MTNKTFDMRHYISLSEGKITESPDSWPFTISELRRLYQMSIGDDNIFDEIANIKYDGYKSQKHQHVYHVLIEDQDAMDGEGPYTITSMMVFLDSKGFVSLDLRADPVASGLETKDALQKFDQM